MHIVIGYLQLRHAPKDANDLAALMRARGAHVVRAEEDVGGADLIKPMLWAICDFIGPGDELITPDLRHLGGNVGAVLEVIHRLEARGACLRLLEPDASTAEPSGQALVRALQQLGRTEPEAPAQLGRKPQRRVDPARIRALRARGLGPSHIAQTLGVSRMTVWRILSQAMDEPAAVDARADQLSLGAEG